MAPQVAKRRPFPGHQSRLLTWARPLRSRSAVTLPRTTRTCSWTLGRARSASHSLSLLPARLSVGSQQNSSTRSSAPRAPLRALMLTPGPGASSSGLFPGPQPRRLRLVVLAGARQRQPVPSVGAVAATQRRETARLLGALRESDAAGDPGGSGAPFRASPLRAPSAPYS